MPEGDDRSSVSSGRTVHFRGFDPYADVPIARRRLPHWRQSGVTYFVTFRLADSLPQPLLHKWRDECAVWLQWHPKPWGGAEQREYEERFVGRVQEWLDAGIGACYLRRSDVRAEVERCLLHFDEERYHVDAFVLMPNHVHAVILPAHGYELSAVLKGIKGVSAKQCNQLLHRESAFWMDEFYDHIVRDAKELAAFRSYIAANPKRAHLTENEYSLQLRNLFVV